MTEEQPDEQHPRGRADHLKPHQFQPGQSGNPGGRPKGTVNLHSRIAKQLLKAIRDADDSDKFADALARKIVAEMLRDPVKAQRLVEKFIERDEGPVVQAVDLTATFTLEDMVRRFGVDDDGDGADDG